MGSANTRVTASADDGRVRRDPGTFSTGTTNLDLGKLSSDSIDLFFRFLAFPIPQGSKITAAKVQFISFSAGGNDTCTVEFSGNDINDAVAPTSTVEFDALTKTTARVGWTPPDFGGQGTLHDSPDISTIIQEIVDRSGWASGNDIIVMVHDDGSSSSARRTATAYDRSPNTDGARLILRWASPGEIWVESEAFHWTDANALERFVIGSQDDHASTESISGWLGV